MASQFEVSEGPFSGRTTRTVRLILALALSAYSSPNFGVELQRLKYNNPGLVVDLGVGLWAWPLPMDFDQDGDLDLIVSSPDKPYNGTYFFENTDGSNKMPIFEPAVRIGHGLRNIQVSFVNGKDHVMTPGQEYYEFRSRGLDEARSLPLDTTFHKVIGSRSSKTRANQWKYCDFDGDSVIDLIIGVGDWSDYGWDNAFDDNGQWTHGPLHGFVYWSRNLGTNDQPAYAKPVKVEANGRPIDVYGWPTPNLADFDQDGDFDLLSGEFLDGFNYFENTGTRTSPVYSEPRRLTHQGQTISMDLQMIVPVAIDWDGDSDMDLVVGDEDGRVALVEHTGEVVDGLPQFLPPVYFQQNADNVMCGALSTPFGIDWDSDGDEDILCGNTAGYIVFYENLGLATGTAGLPKWAAPQQLTADGRVIRVQAGSNGSIQGPCEAKWGYTTFTAADWDHDGLNDLIVNSIWGRVVWYRNLGPARKPRLVSAQPVRVNWPAAPPKPEWNWWNPGPTELVTQWRTTPVVVDWDHDGMNDLVMLDHEGFVALYRRARGKDGELVLMPGRRCFVDGQGNPIRLNSRQAGGSGRRKLAVVDWDNDGRIDLLQDAENTLWWRNIGQRGSSTILENRGLLDSRKLSSHTTSPTTVDWNRDDVRDLLVGAEDGFLYFKLNENDRLN